MNKIYRIVVPLMAVWLVICIVLTWASILDDAMIHLRYADNLLRTHFITYDGVHPNYGVSSLLYVSLLAFLRSFISSPNLPRGVASVAHLLLFSGIAVLLARSIPRQASRARLLGLLLLLILVAPSALRWLDDGMETGLALCFTSLLCWLTFREAHRSDATPSSSPGLVYAGLLLVGFLTVLLRTELAMLCAICVAILTLKKAGSARDLSAWIAAALKSSHFIVGAGLAMLVILLKMHVLLPDTAVAKSHGLVVWRGVLISTGHAVAGGFSFGVGLLILWLLTFFLLLRSRRISLPLLLANAVFPITLTLAVLRGQEVQGIRYLAWTLLFSALWNILELGIAELGIAELGIASPNSPLTEQTTSGRTLIYALLALALVVQPIEASVIYPIMASRAKLMTIVPHRHLDVLQGKLGVAADVGIIGYFSKANICDVSGLVNGRDFARLNSRERLLACAASKPDFLYFSIHQITHFNEFFPAGDWQVCGEYEMAGLGSKDIHYLIVPPATAEQICKETSGAQPYSVSRLMALTKPTAETSPN
jgi:hypothetical protein